MKLHLPITLLSAVLAAFIALPAQAVEAPEGYTAIYLNTPGELENYTSHYNMAFILESSLEFSPSSAAYWTASTPLISRGNVFFGSNDSNSPVALSFKDGEDSVFSPDVGDLTFEALSNLTFSSIERSAIKSFSGLTIRHNDVVTFSDNSGTLPGGGESYGGAICSSSKLTISDNGNVSFSRNSSTSSYGDHDFGGAICLYSEGTINHNRNVTFCNNYTTGIGGAISTKSDLTFSNNGNVTFCDNSASKGGGAIYSEQTLTFSNNGDVSFCDNSSSKRGGAISVDYAVITPMPLSDNDDNSGRLLTIHNNKDIIFSGNHSLCGGAIYIAIFNGKMSIQGNDSVLFERNYENTNGAYRLRSIYSTGGMTLSAKTGGNITFYDSVYTSGTTYFNSNYTDAEGNTQSAGGDVIFSGKYAEEHLNEILAANNEDRTATAEEILNSQTSIIEGNAYISGGSLQIKDGAVLNVNGDTVNIASGSKATLAISDAELVAANATIEVGESATLQLSNGASVTADQINIAAGATLALGDIAITTAVSDAMVAAYRVSSLNVINADLTFAAGSTLVTDGTGINMTEVSVLTFNATSEGEKINLVFTLGAEYSEVDQVVLFSNVDIVKFLMDGEEVASSTTLLASDFFTGECINENTTLTYDSTSKAVYLQGVSKVVPEPTTATLSLLALAALAMRRRRK